MLKIIFILLLAVVISVLTVNYTQYTQNDYILLTERYELVSHNEKYMTNPILKNFKFNRTQFAVNLTWSFSMDINNSLMVHFQAYKFASNEYRLFPIAFPVNFCDVLGRNVFGLQNLYNCGKMFLCPIKKGNYEICNWNPDYSKFPPRVPRGRYRFDCKWMYKSDLIMLGYWYFEIKDVDLFIQF